MNSRISEKPREVMGTGGVNFNSLLNILSDDFKFKIYTGKYNIKTFFNLSPKAENHLESLIEREIQAKGLASPKNWLSRLLNK